ncbi:MAG TPA: methyltransferase [Bacteroidia bacterium]|nr:methyltransferase [Bacteroidia bacterium]HNS11591.1 methyltransferase [Bacteroidia bacterium]
MQEVIEMFQKDTRNAMDSKIYAQQIAFAPFVFQSSRALRNFGLLSIIEDSGEQGISAEAIQSKTSLSVYSVRVLLEAGLGIGLITLEDGMYALTRTGYFILHDKMTIANMDFTHDVCYEGLFDLDKSLLSGKPEGLKVFGEWKTVYEALAHLPEHVRKSWFAFDHYYSSDSFPVVLENVFKSSPKKILDIGGNTGKWALQCFNHSPDIKVGIADLPGQLNIAKQTISNNGFADRAEFFEIDLLDKNTPLPKGFDVIWMSQFLDCFSEDEIVSILKRCYDAIDENGQVIILEPLWDKQTYEVSAFCLQMTSLYFTAIANGNSQMYHSELFTALIRKAGFSFVERIDRIGICHSMMKCRK